MIKQVDSFDLNGVSKCHQKSFPKSLSSLLGLRYVEAMLSWYLESPNGFIFLSMNESEVEGYCGGIIVNGNLAMGSASSMAQYSFDSAVIAFIKRPWLIFHPEMFRKYKFVIRNLWYRIFPPKPKNQQKTGFQKDHTGLVVIGVDPRFQGQGIGQQLLMEFEKRSKELGIHLMKLTVKADNSQAIGAYKKSGWEVYSDDGKSVGMQKILK